MPFSGYTCDNINLAANGRQTIVLYSTCKLLSLPPRPPSSPPLAATRFVFPAGFEENNHCLRSIIDGRGRGYIFGQTETKRQLSFDVLYLSSGCFIVESFYYLFRLDSEREGTSTRLTGRYFLVAGVWFKVLYYAVITSSVSHCKSVICFYFYRITPCSGELAS